MKRQSNKESGRKSIPLSSKVLYLPISMFDKEIKSKKKPRYFFIYPSAVAAMILHW